MSQGATKEEIDEILDESYGGPEQGPTELKKPEIKQPKVNATFFSQLLWKDYFDEKFSRTACAATSLLNGISMLFTQLTNKPMTLELGLKILQAGVTSTGIRRTDANVDNWQKAMNSMWKATGLPGKLVYNEKNPQYRILALDTKTGPTAKDKEPEHFVLVIDKDGNMLFDPYTSTKEYVDIITPGFEEFIGIRRLQAGRPYRGFDYVSE